MMTELLGKEAAIFLPSGTMCNEIAVLVHCRPGDEILCDKTAHILNVEGGAPAALAGAMVRPLEGHRGVYDAEQLRAGIRGDNRYEPRSRLAAIEQTVNIGGGTVWPLAAIESVAAAARDAGLAIHMDGARLMNAAVASGRPAREHAQPVDSVWLDLSKGLGCPVGAVLAGSADFIAEAWRWKQRLGGAMRQAGIIAAAGIHALENNVERLAEDHANARRFAEAIAEIPGVALELDAVETNIVFFEVAAPGLDAAELARRLETHGVRIGAMGPRRLRAVTHLDVTAAQIDEAAAALRAVLAEGD
jgi:threonine aldolase